VVCGPTIAVPETEWDLSLPLIADALTGVADLADRLCQE